MQSGSREDIEVGRVIIGCMLEAGVPGEVVYAFRKTGLIVARTDWEKYPKSMQVEWLAALDEFHACRLHTQSGTA